MKSILGCGCFILILFSHFSAKAIDLVATSVEAPSSITAGQAYSGFTLGACLKEVNKQATTTVIVRLYLSQDDVYDAGTDVLLGERTRAVNPGVDESCAYPSGTVPTTSWATGPIYIIAIIDATNLVSETDENNNMRTKLVNYVNTPTGIIDGYTTEDVSLIVFPNPAHDVVSVKYAGEAEVKLLNANGDLVYQTSGTNETLLPLHTVAPGLYFVELKNLQQVRRKRLVVN